MHFLQGHLLSDVSNFHNINTASIDFELRGAGIQGRLRNKLTQNGEDLDLNAALGANRNDTVIAINLDAIGGIRVGETAACNLVRGLAPLQLCNGFMTDSQSYKHCHDD